MFLHGGPYGARTRVVALTVATLGLGCGEETSEAVIGFAFPNYGAPAVWVARDEIARWGPGAQRRLRIVYDSVTQGDPADIEIERAQRLVAIPGLVGVVGHGGSRGSLAAAPIYNRAEIPQIVPTGTSGRLKSAGPWTFTLAPDNATEGAFIADFLVERLEVRSATIFFVNDEYGSGLAEAVRAGLQEQGIELIDRVSVDPQSDFGPLLQASLRRGEPEAVILATRHVAAGRIARLVLERLPSVSLVAGDGALILPGLPKEAGAAADSIYAVAFWTADSPNPVSREFVERFRRLVGRDPVSSDAMTHDGLMLLAHAVREVGPDPQAIRKFLLELGDARPPYPGVTGRITFREDRPPRLTMVRLRQGKIVRVGQE